MALSAIASKEVKVLIDLDTAGTGLGTNKTATATPVTVDKYYIVSEHVPGAAATWTPGTGGTVWTPSTTVSEVGKILKGGSTAPALVQPTTGSIKCVQANFSKLENKKTFQPTPTQETIDAKNDDNPSGVIYGDTSYKTPVTATYGGNPVQKILIANKSNDSYFVAWCDRASVGAQYTCVKMIGKLDKDYSANPVDVKGELGMEGVPFSEDFITADPRMALFV